MANQKGKSTMENQWQVNQHALTLRAGSALESIYQAALSRKSYLSPVAWYDMESKERYYYAPLTQVDEEEPDNRITNFILPRLLAFEAFHPDMPIHFHLCGEINDGDITPLSNDAVLDWLQWKNPKHQPDTFFTSGSWFQAIDQLFERIGLDEFISVIWDCSINRELMMDKIGKQEIMSNQSDDQPAPGEAVILIHFKKHSDRNHRMFLLPNEQQLEHHLNQQPEQRQALKHTFIPLTRTPAGRTRMLDYERHFYAGVKKPVSIGLDMLCGDIGAAQDPLLLLLALQEAQVQGSGIALSMNSDYACIVEQIQPNP